jgi:succinate-acetate transporter protein
MASNGRIHNGHAHRDLESNKEHVQRIETLDTILPPTALDFDPEGDKKRFRKFGDGGPLGLAAFAVSTYVLSLINLHSRGVTTPNITVGLAFFYGGIAQTIAGLWDFASGNTFGGTAFVSYGGFWLSFASIFMPSFNIAGAYKTPGEFNAALGFYLMAWFIFTAMLTVGSIRTTIPFFLMLLTLALTFLILSIAHMKLGDIMWVKAGGVFGMISATLAWYLASAGLWTYSNSFIQLPVPAFPWSERSG